MSENTRRESQDTSNYYLSKNPNFFRHNQPLSTQFKLLHKDFWYIETSTMDVGQYNFTTSQGQGLTLNRYVNIMAIEETIFPPIPGTKGEEDFYQKLRSSRRRFVKEAESKKSELLSPKTNDQQYENSSSTRENFNHTVRILTTMKLFRHSTPITSKTESTHAEPRPRSNHFRYINGNLIDLEDTPLFVASQAPIESGMSDFFATLYEYQIQLVIMLTRTVEDEVEKAFEYWPTTLKGDLTEMNHTDNSKVSESNRDSLSFGEMTVSVNPEEAYYTDKRLGLIYRPLLIYPRDGRASMPLLHIQYTGWPDLGVPSSSNALCELFKVIDIYQGKAPILVHCSAGVGRTGTFIGTYAALQAIENGCFENKTLRRTVIAMRSARPMMVQRVEQYLFMYQILLTKLGLDMSKFAARLQQSAIEYHQTVAALLSLRERQPDKVVSRTNK